MAILTAILTHQDAAAVERQRAYLRALAPSSRFVVCHGGRRADFEALDGEDILFIGDPSLRGDLYSQSYSDTLVAVHDAYVRDDPTVELVYLIEFDHLILRGDFERSLAELAERTGAGLIAKGAGTRNDTNWSHYVRYLGDERIARFFEAVSRRDDPAVRWGCLGSGMLFRRAALAAFCAAAADAPPCYLELLVPTLVYHLGFDVVNVDALGDLYMTVRWRPEYTLEEAVGAQRAGRTFLHPFKQLDRLGEISPQPLAAAS
jgi:hypothetical protein